MPTSWDKLVRKLILNPHGREALKRVGIEIDIAKDEQELKSKPIVVVLCPTYRSPEPQMQDALGAMVRYTREKDFATIYSGPPVSASVVHWSRNWLVAEHLKSGKPWTHVLFIDDDIVIEPDTLERLLSHKKDIVAGLCTRRTDPPIPNFRRYDEEIRNMEQIWEWPANQLIEVDAVGTGLMLISQHALEQVAQAYFDCLYEKEFYGLDGERLETIRKARLKCFDDTKMCFWFRFLPTARFDIEMGEDVSFCFVAKRYCGLSIHVDTSVQPGHLGPYPYSVRDFLPYRDQCIAKAKAEGSYKARESRPFSVVILSANPQNLIECIYAIRNNEPDLPFDRIIVVWDGPESPIPDGVTRIEGKKPFIFARNANLGMSFADGDVILLNDDALLQTEKGFTKLSQAGPGIVSAAIKGIVGNRNQMPRGAGLRRENRMLCFIAVFIPKEVQDKIGPLDERFTAYGFDDNDYCRRALESGIPLSTFDGCIVEHGTLKPTFRSKENWVELMGEAQKIYEEKYALPAQR